MSMQQFIESRVQTHFMPTYLALENESHRHSGPATESHFKLTVVSPKFAGLSPVKRHQAVYGVLTEALQNGVHALALHLYTPEEWATSGGAAPDSPDCRGGSKAS